MSPTWNKVSNYRAQLFNTGSKEKYSFYWNYQSNLEMHNTTTKTYWLRHQKALLLKFIWKKKKGEGRKEEGGGEGGGAGAGGEGREREREREERRKRKNKWTTTKKKNLFF